VNIKNIACYAFFKPTFQLEAMRESLLARMHEHDVKGTIILSHEGMNCSLSAEIEKMDAFAAFLFEQIGLKNPDIKISFSNTVPFRRRLVKIKSYIVPQPGQTSVDLTIEGPAPFISPEKFHEWLQSNKEMIVLDTRNDYEYEMGRFKNSTHLGTKIFSQFEDDLQKAPTQWALKPIVTFCTGGIRCEKAAPVMLKKGFTQVYQLQGGILNYFEKMGRGYFEGECYVFDERLAVAP